MRPKVPGPSRNDYDRLYVIRCGDFYKVGVSYNIEQRIREMQLCNPYPLELALYRTVRTTQVRLVERRVHELLAEWEHGREWFTAPLAQIRAAVKIAMLEAEKRHRAFIANPPRPKRTKSETRGIGAEWTQGQGDVTLSQIKKANKAKMLQRLEKRPDAYQ